ncbi:hypothetical protein L915_11366 [Phytophthora nicotianae]|uniref:RxLR effector protein n=1 Tax=Phytophthora nicotianae TaxID=4792 RepID=W2GKA3_PHYNI|nr:hypothetical protein L915_11366 [Phytophthora nicotianae]
MITLLALMLSRQTAASATTPSVKSPSRLTLSRRTTTWIVTGTYHR